MEPDRIITPEGRQIASVRVPGCGPGVVFMGGFRSDMTGTKALHLENLARGQGRAFLRFDYSGHGASSGRFEDGCIGDWAADAVAVLDALTTGPQVLVGSSMGGWIALLVAQARPGRVAGMVGIAAAPDFTEDLVWARMDDAARARMASHGRIEEPSIYSDSPYVYTRRLIEEGRNHLVLRKPLALPFPARFLQGTADADVPPAHALRLLDHATGPDIRLTLVKGADHRMSSPGDLRLISQSLAEVMEDADADLG